MTSYGLNGLDLKLLEYINFRDGFFIEAGANDGMCQSNTCILERELGWKGLLVEPNQSKYRQCISNRPNSIVENYALVSSSYTEEFIEGDFDHNDNHYSLMSMVQDRGDYVDGGIIEARIIKKGQHPIVKVPVTTLNKLMEKHNITKIDFMSLDVEGYEISVLNGFDLNKFSPTYFLIETTTFEDRKKSIVDYMLSKNYSIVKQISDNDLLLKHN